MRLELSGGGGVNVHAASSGGVNCGVVIPKEVFVVHVASVFEKVVVDLVEVGWSR